MDEYKSILYLVGVILVEIRASENLEKSKVLADIVHNVPAKISIGRPEVEIIQDVMSRAARLGIEKTILRYLDLANKSVKPM